MNLFSVLAQNNLVANLVVFILFLASLCSWYLIFSKTYQLYGHFKALKLVKNLNLEQNFLENQQYKTLPKNSAVSWLFTILPNLQAKNRLLRMGENLNTVHVVGSPDLDVMNEEKLPPIIT